MREDTFVDLGLLKGDSSLELCCFMGGGHYFPIFLAFPKQRMKSCLLGWIPPGTLASCHTSGWMQENLLSWLSIMCNVWNLRKDILLFCWYMVIYQTQKHCCNWYFMWKWRSIVVVLPVQYAYNAVAWRCTHEASYGPLHKGSKEFKEGGLSVENFQDLRGSVCSGSEFEVAFSRCRFSSTWNFWSADRIASY
jgi:hypothetical protein